MLSAFQPKSVRLSDIAAARVSDLHRTVGKIISPAERADGLCLRGLYRSRPFKMILASDCIEEKSMSLLIFAMFHSL